MEQMIGLDPQKEAEKVAQRAAEFFGIPVPALAVVNARKGYAYYRQYRVTIPAWTVGYGREYFTAYVIHEVAHLYRSTRPEWTPLEPGHGAEFKAAERSALKALCGLVPVYKRIYIKALRTVAGDTVFSAEILLAQVAKNYEAKRVRAVNLAKPVRVRKPTPLEIILAD